MGRGTAVRIPDSQTLSVFYRVGQNRIRQIEEQIVALTTERRELVSACQNFPNATNTTYAGTTMPTGANINLQAGTQPTVIRKRKPMSQAHRASLRQAALNRKQAATATSTGAGTAPSPPGPTTPVKRQSKTAVAAAG